MGALEYLVKSKKEILYDELIKATGTKKASDAEKHAEALELIKTGSYYRYMNQNGFISS